MPLPASGNSLSLNQMHIEAGGSSGTTCSLNDADIRGLISKSSGVAMAFNEWFGASASVADYSTTLTAGHTSVTTTIGYSSSTSAARGFLFVLIDFYYLLYYIPYKQSRQVQGV